MPVLLAAGTSSRMGEHKLLLPVLGEPMVRRAARTILDAGFTELLVVLGRDAKLVEAALHNLPCTFVINKNFANGKMQTSFKTALENIGSSDAALFALADMPLLPSSVYKKLRAEFSQTSSRSIVASRFSAFKETPTIAPPHVFAKNLFRDLVEHGARPTIEKNFQLVHWQDWPEEWLQDIDTPEDYAVLLAKLKK